MLFRSGSDVGVIVGLDVGDVGAKVGLAVGV